MPPKSKITKEMITTAAYEIVRKSGIDNLNARNIAEKLGCSTQPVLYCFKTMDEIKAEVYRIADDFHSEYITQDVRNGTGDMASIGRNYIRFGYEEKHLFRFLFQSNIFSGQMQGLFDDERLMPVLQVLCNQTGLGIEDAKKFFAAIFYPIHGIASLLANNSLEYKPEEYGETTEMIFRSVLKEMKGE